MINLSVALRFAFLSITTFFIMLIYTLYYYGERPDYGFVLSQQLVAIAYGLYFTYFLLPVEKN